MPQYAHDLHDGTTNLMVMFDDANETVCDDGNMDLNADSILILAPKGLDLEVLLDPFEEQFNLPSILITKSDFTCFEIEVVGIICERSLQIRSIVNNLNFSDSYT